MKILKRILFLLSFAVLYLIFKEFVELYLLARSLHPVAGYGMLLLLLGVSYYFIGVPIYRIIRIPVAYGPTRDASEVPALIRKRMAHLRQNQFLRKKGYDFTGVPDNEAGYLNVIRELEPEAERIRARYVSQLFYSSSIAQNGFLDAILIFSASVNLIKEIFVLYNGRVSNRDLLVIGKKVYYSIAIGGSEGVEYATEEILTKLTSGGVKSIPFADKVFGSIADGFVNAALLTRVALITENYCTKLHIHSDRDLIPSPTLIVDTAKRLTRDVRSQLSRALKQLGQSSWDKTKDIAGYAANPMRYLYEKIVEDRSSNSSEDADVEPIRESLSLSVAYSPFGIGFGRVIDFFRRDKD